jgi:hypothetical protein
MLLMVNFVPHHHHDGFVCMVRDNFVNDEHADHHDERDMVHDYLCIAEAEFIVPRIENEIKCEVSSCDNPDHVHIFPILFLVSDFLLFPSSISSIKFEYGDYVSFYTSAETSRFCGLRGPPFFS